MINYTAIVGRQSSSDMLYLHFIAKDKEIIFNIFNEIFKDNDYFIFEGHLLVMSDAKQFKEAESPSQFFRRIYSLYSSIGSLMNRTYQRNTKAGYLKQLEIFTDYIGWYENYMTVINAMPLKVVKKPKQIKK